MALCLHILNNYLNTFRYCEKSKKQYPYINGLTVYDFPVLCMYLQCQIVMGQTSIKLQHGTCSSISNQTLELEHRIFVFQQTTNTKPNHLNYLLRNIRIGSNNTFWTLIGLEHVQLLAIKLYFWLRTDRHQTLFDSSLILK